MFLSEPRPEEPDWECASTQVKDALEQLRSEARDELRGTDPG